MKPLKKMNLLKKNSITLFEIVLWVVFFLFLLSTYILTMPVLESFLLIIGLSVGIIAILRILMLCKDMKNYSHNKKEMAAWAYRFCIFKVVPVFLPMIAKSFK